MPFAYVYVSHIFYKTKKIDFKREGNSSNATKENTAPFFTLNISIEL